MGKIKKLLTEKILALLTIVVLVGVVGVGTLLTKAQQNPVYVTFGVDKTQVTPGEELTYTLYVKNNTSADLTNVVASVSIDSVVTYVSGSGVFNKGSQQFNIPNPWVADRLNMGTMASGQENSVVFKVNVPSSLAVGVGITSSGQIEPEGFSAQTYQVTSTVVSAS